MLPLLLVRAVVCCTLALAVAPPAARADEREAKIGRGVLAQLQKHGKIVTGTPANAVVDAIGARLGATARTLYDEPFRFYIVRDKAINAFAVPGGYMFVNDGLIAAVGTKDELAGVMCHEMNHVIHHDATTLMRRANAMEIPLAVAGLVLRSPGAVTAVRGADYAAQFSMLHYSRKVETAADLGGADLCARTGYNPYGLVWTMETLIAHQGGQQLEMISNHPRDDHRIADLEDHFRADPALFGRFRDDRAHAVPVLAHRDVPGPLPFAQPACPTGERGTLSAEEAGGWFGAANPWLAPRPATPAPREAPPRIADDAILLGERPAATRFAPKRDAEAVVLAFDPAAHATLDCEITPSFARIALVGAMYPPPFRVAASDLGVARTRTGIVLGAPAADVVRLYGAAAAEPASGGTTLYRYAAADNTGAGVTMWFRVKDGVVTAFGRDTTY